MVPGTSDSDDPAYNNFNQDGAPLWCIGFQKAQDQAVTILGGQISLQFIPKMITNCLFSRTTTFQQLLEKYTIALGLIVFGDSIADQGNNNNLSSIMKCNFPPYGIDFTGGLATGRFTNARTPSDMIAAELGIKELVPAYLDPSLQIKDLSTGASFASVISHLFCGYQVRTILAIGCGCGSFEAHLFSKGLLTMCLLEFEASGSQVQPTPTNSRKRPSCYAWIFNFDAVSLSVTLF
ncbi:hypothetical protein POM88_053140 [Heracleum sosnowskyi]|uniref:GDSL esterase/lipase n=1 Tax=Heracleum sosnowskyi TaxID=360622 RepID=A0AAD8GR65_9APIA|nr:hypothetical protein POM88_053140 [Heracleum sosnowskyi]